MAFIDDFKNEFAPEFEKLRQLGRDFSKLRAEFSQRAQGIWYQPNVMRFRLAAKDLVIRSEKAVCPPLYEWHMARTVAKITAQQNELEDEIAERQSPPRQKSTLSAEEHLELMMRYMEPEHDLRVPEGLDIS